MADIRMTTQSAVRRSFWNNAPSRIRGYYVRGMTQNEYPADVRAYFVDYVDTLARDGDITAALADRVTL